MKKALITGITGQDGSYLAELLLEKGYEVHGIMRRASTFNTGRVEHLYVDPHAPGARFFLHYGDLSDTGTLRHILSAVKPSEVYNLGAQSHVLVFRQTAEYTADVSGVGVLRMLEALRDFVKETGIPTRFYQASSSEMFGSAPPPQSETTPFHPRSPYGTAKVFGYHTTINYREAYGLFASNGILFNHESPRRGETFVTRKITRGLSRIKRGLEPRLWLGKLDSKRDWGYAKDYVEGIWRILQAQAPDDYVLATGTTHTVREFAEKSAAFLEFNLEWTGTGISERGVDAKTGQVLIEIDPRYFRPTEVDVLLGDASKAHRLLGWEATTSFDRLVELMVKADYDAIA